MLWLALTTLVLALNSAKSCLPLLGKTYADTTSFWIDIDHDYVLQSTYTDGVRRGGDFY